MNARLILEDGTSFAGTAFGANDSVAGEVVFNTGMVGYPECLTDPSYKGQILVLTYPLVGNYGVPALSAERFNEPFESGRIQALGLVVARQSAQASHWGANLTLDQWLAESDVPGLTGVDTRALAQRLRARGTMPGQLVHQEKRARPPIDTGNLVEQVSVRERREYGAGSRRVVLVDYGFKNNVLRLLLRHGLAVTVVPWNHPLEREPCDGVVLSNGPGDPQQCRKPIRQVRQLLQKEVPVFGICLGSQILALAAGASTYKLRFGHRGQNQPCVLVGSKRCFITSQNHGYAVREESLPEDWAPWFYNANDGTNEGIRHRSKPFRGVQFHPEASPGPSDTEFLFDDFVRMLS